MCVFYKLSRQKSFSLLLGGKMQIVTIFGLLTIFLLAIFWKYQKNAKLLVEAFDDNFGDLIETCEKIQELYEKR